MPAQKHTSNWLHHKVCI